MKHSGGSQSHKWFNCLKILERVRGEYNILGFLKWRKKIRVKRDNTGKSPFMACGQVRV